VLEISAGSCPDLSAKWFPVTIDADEAYDNGMIRDLPGPSIPEVCTASLIVNGGSLLGCGNVPLPLGSGPWTCPPGSYFHGDEICPFWYAGQSIWFVCEGSNVFARVSRCMESACG
jgi:hypothetical protein